MTTMKHGMRTLSGMKFLTKEMKMFERTSTKVVARPIDMPLMALVVVAKVGQQPTAALDVKYKALIHDDMKAFTKNGGLLIIVTHEREEMDMCNRCYRIIGGINEEV